MCCSFIDTSALAEFCTRSASRSTTAGSTNLTTAGAVCASRTVGTSTILIAVTSIYTRKGIISSFAISLTSRTGTTSIHTGLTSRTNFTRLTTVVVVCLQINFTPIGNLAIHIGIIAFAANRRIRAGTDMRGGYINASPIAKVCSCGASRCTAAG